MQTSEHSATYETCTMVTVAESVGVPRFDAEHVRLAELLQGATLAVHDRTSPQLLRESLSQIFAYALMHFSEEENAMAEVGYPELKAHRAEHERILERLQLQLQQYDTDPWRVALDIVDMLEHWMHRHIREFDVAYSRYLH